MNTQNFVKAGLIGGLSYGLNYFFLDPSVISVYGIMDMDQRIVSALFNAGGFLFNKTFISPLLDDKVENMGFGAMSGLITAGVSYGLHITNNSSQSLNLLNHIIVNEASQLASENAYTYLLKDWII